MDTINEELKNNIYLRIREAIPSELKILYICLTGSQGKNMASAESDYDTRVIVQNPLENYIFKRSEETARFKNELDGRELEGQAIDIIKAFDYSLENNACMLDILRGTPVFCESKELIDQLRMVFERGFEPIITLTAFQAILYHYLTTYLQERSSKKEKIQDRKFIKEAPVKFLVECIFIALEIRCVLAEKDIFEYFDIDKLMEFAGEDEEFMRPLIRLRRTDRIYKVPITEEFIKLIKKTIALLDEYKEKVSKEKKQVVDDNKTILRKEIEKTCLGLIFKSKEATQ